MNALTQPCTETTSCCETTKSPRPNVRYRTPPVDLYETEKAFVLAADVPGASAEGVNLRIEGEDLVLDVKANHASAPGIQRDGAEMAYRRKFTLGRAISREDIQAKIQHGVLTVTLPKVPEKQPRKIEVKH